MLPTRQPASACVIYLVRHGADNVLLVGAGQGGKSTLDHIAPGKVEKFDAPAGEDAALQDFFCSADLVFVLPRLQNVEESACLLRVANCARKKGKLVLALVFTPECSPANPQPAASKLEAIAQGTQTVDDLHECVDAIFWLPPETCACPEKEMRGAASGQAKNTIKHLCGPLYTPGPINVGIADLRSIFEVAQSGEKAGNAVMAFSRINFLAQPEEHSTQAIAGKGPRPAFQLDCSSVEPPDGPEITAGLKALEALEKAVTLDRVKGLFINITAGSEITMQNVDAVIALFTLAVPLGVPLLFGLALNSALQNAITVSVMAAFQA